MSAISMTYGRPARLDPRPLIDSARAAWHGLIQLPRRFDAWLEARDQARMTADDVLALARRIEDSDPGFAADLRGAALRAIDLH